jgi:hypothetical protein
MRSGLIWVIAVLPLAACIDFVNVTEPATEGRSALLRVYIQIPAVPVEQPGTSVLPGAARPDSILVDAVLHLGIDSRGERRRVASDTLWVMNVALLPTGIGEHGALLYRGVFKETDPQARSTGATVLPPRVDGITARSEVRWYAPRRLDPDTLLLRRGDDLHLRLAVPPSSTIREGWMLSLEGSGGRVSSFRQGALPTTISMPAVLIPYGSGGLLNAVVNHDASWGDDRTSPARNADYLVDIHVQTHMHWIVRMVDL